MTNSTAPTPPPAPTPGPGDEPVISLVDVVKEYPGTPPVRALTDIDLTVERGEYVGIVGPSGSGKSTLLNLLGALDRPSEGSVRIGGRDLAQLTDAELSAARGHHIGFVFQSFNLISGLDAVENVGLGLLYAGVPKAERRERSLYALERVGLAHRSAHRPGTLSGGERQRVAIARAIVTRPDLLLADEPTGNLDSHTGADIFEQFAALHDEGSTIVLITHDRALADRLPRRVTLQDGRLVGDEMAVG